MKRWILAALVVLGLSGIAGPDSGHAHSMAPPPEATTSASPEPVVDTGIGGYAAVGCGLFGRALGHGMVNAGVLAGAIATCGYMFIDALFFN